MRINNNLNYDNKNHFINKQNSFRAGLPSWFIKEARTVNPDYVESELSRKGISATFNGESVVAACCKKVVEIMENYGFELPKNFSFERLDKGTLGAYSPSLDTVYINSGYKEFKDLKKLNKLEESQIGYHPKSGHFLQTYLHEFSHAAHYKNLCNELGDNEASNVFWGFLTDHSPRDIIIGPMNSILKMFINNKILLKLVDYAVPRANGLYAKTDLCEYIAEKNARLIAEDLGDNLTQSYNNDIPFVNSPYYWNFQEAFQEIKNTQSLSTIIRAIKDALKYIDNDVWNGDITKLNSNLFIK